jgi:hypothetical protein
VIPRTFPPAPGWSPDGRRIKSEVDYGRGPEKTWVYGALRVRDGHEVTMTAPSRNSAYYQQFLQKVEAANPVGDIYVVTDNTISAGPVKDWPARAALRKVRHQPSWRLSQQRLATSQLNTRARPWVGGRPAPPTRLLRRRHVYIQ